MNFPLYVARRYLTARRKQAFISVITFISVLGVGIGVAALVIAIALITGFQGDVQAKILGATAHLMVSDLSGQGLRDYPELIDRVEKVPGVEAATPVVYNTVLITGPAKTTGAVLKGVDFSREEKASPWLRTLVSGKIPTEGAGDGILLGRDLAFAIGAGPGDVIHVVTPSSRLTPLGAFPKTRKLRVTGIFSAGLYEYDSTTALIPLADAQALFGMPGRASFLQLRIRDIFQADRIAERLRRVLPPSTYVTTWMELNRSLFSALKLEKTIIFLTILLIVLVAALNIVATLILLVMEKTRDIGILMAMGATRPEIRKIFFFQGALIGVIGTAFGTALGLAWCWVANVFRLIRIPVDIYQISYVPFRMKLLDLLMIVGATLAVTFVSTLFPSRRAARVDPVVALKYE